jgi:Aspartyl protease
VKRRDFYSHNHCLGQVVYWTRDEVSKISVEITRYHQINLHVRIDGKEVWASLDTGTSRSVMSLELAETLFDLSENMPKMKPLAAPGVFVYPFHTLTFGGVTVGNPDIVLISDKYSRPVLGAARVILGLGILRHLHMFIAYSESNLYVSAADAH